MKKISLLLFALSISLCVIAQNPYIMAEGLVEKDGSHVISIPSTTLVVDVSVESETIISGPYARYAQKFLGVRAPLADKVNYEVKSATIVLMSSEQLAIGEVEGTIKSIKEHVRPQDGFATLFPDRVRMSNLLPEQAAQEAANTIFMLRRSRLDLITGTIGENVYGGGLESALAEIAAIEQEYLELFLGKVITKSETKRFVTVMDSNKKQYLLCRFSPTAGFLPSMDLSGDMIFLQIVPTGAMPTVAEAGEKDSNFMTFRVAAPSVCSVVYAGRELVQVQLPIFEFGRTVKVAVSKKK